MATTETVTSEPASRMTLRRPPFAFSRDKALHWNAGKPEFSQIVNAASLAMPYLEPYLIKTMREARPLITDAQLVRDLDLYCGQESAHYRQHRKFNDELKALRPEIIDTLEAALAADYARLARDRSLTFNLAYAEGFESMALAIGHMLIEEREFLFGGAESAVASLVLWHFVEEIEHKNVTFDVFKHISGSYLWRITGLFYATGHIMWRTRRGYHALLKADGLWRNLRSRLALAHVLFRIFKSLTPKFLRILHPAYHPSQVADPEWVSAWAAIYEASDTAAARLDTHRLREALPVALPA
ncbi:MAG: metal-dependent hydrolase [Parvibaculum sp.]|nr:metal-dependent hydrolase [Parvibaculum sp.]